MDNLYADFLDKLAGDANLYRTLSFQLTFISYLLLGQVALLLVWWLLRRKARKWAWESSLFALYLLVGQIGLFYLWSRLVAAWLSASNVLLADILATVHFGFVLSVLLIEISVLVGWLLKWDWTRNFWIRLAQVLAIEIVAGQVIVGIECPLTTVERELRGGVVYVTEKTEASAIGRFCNQRLYSREPSSAFLYIYGGFGLLVALTWIFIPPRLPGQGREGGESNAGVGATG